MNKNMQKLQRNSLYKARRTILLSLAILMFIFFIPTISSLEFDNVISYEKDDMLVNFDNLFGLGKHFGEIELKSHSSVTEIKGYGFGKEEVVMYYDFTNWELYKDGLGDVKFINMNTNKEIEKEYSFVEWKEFEIDVNDYERVCNTLENKTEVNCVSNIIGTHKENRFEWVEYKSNDIPARDVRIGLKTYVGKNDYVDGILTIVGKEVNKHITWTGDLSTGLVSYYQLDEGSGNAQDETATNHMTTTNLLYGQAGATANTGTSFNFSTGAMTSIVANPTGLDGDISASMWVKPYFLVGGDVMLQMKGASSSVLQFNGHSATNAYIYAYDGSDTATSSFDFSSCIGTWCWVYLEMDRDATMKLWVNNVIKLDNASTWSGLQATISQLNIGNDNAGSADFNGGIDEVSIWNRQLSEAERIYLYNSGDYCAYGDDACGSTPPNVTLNTPTNNTNLTATNIVTFNATVEDYTNTIVNVSLMLNGVVNETNVTGVNGSAYYFIKTLAEGNHNWSIRAWSDLPISTTENNFTLSINTTPNIVFGVGVPTDYNNQTTDNFEVNVTLTETFFKNITFDLFSNGVLNQTVTFTNASRNKVWANLPDATYSYNVTTATTTNKFNQTATRNINVDSSNPAVDVFSPISNIEFHEINTNLSLNWSANDTNLDTCIYNYNTTNLTITCSDNQTQINITEYNNNNLTFWVNDSFGNMNRTLVSWDYRLFKVSESFTASLSEGSSSTFTINLLTNGSDITIGNLSYNATQNIGVVTESSTDNFSLSRSITAPVVSTDTNLPFFWRITQGSFSYDSDSQNQTITNINLDDCSVNQFVLYNFTMVDEETQTKLIGIAHNTSGKVDLQLLTSDRTLTLVDYSTFFNETNSFAVCLNSSFSVGETFSVDALVEYDAKDYAKEFYNIQRSTITNSSFDTAINLYDLKDANAQEFKITFKDANFIAVSDALIQIQRNYIDEGVFKTVEIPKTDEQGETIGNLVVDEVIYTFIVIKNGATLGTFNNVRANCQNPTIQTCTISLNSFASYITPDDYTSLDDFTYTLTYDNDTRTVESIFTIPSSTVGIVMLNTTLSDALGTTQVCSDILTTSSGTLSCVVPHNVGNGTVLIILTKDDVEQARGSIDLAEYRQNYGTNGVFLSLILMLTLIGLGLGDNPMITGLFMILGAILGLVLSLSTGTIGIGTTVIWLIVAVAIILIKGSRRS